MDLLNLLPAPYQSDTNISLFNNLFNRFLSKQEIKKVSGYIGQGNTNAIVSRQIQENDVHRQAFQLQPILYNKIGTIEHMASWQDIQNELTRLGVDMDDFARWGAAQQFNWVPPVDINKIINYRDYYWVDEQSNSSPQYITIRSRCAVATSLVTFWDGLITQYGSIFPIVDILEIDDTSTLPVYSVTAIDSVGGFVTITGDARTDLLNGHFFNLTGTVSNNATYNITTVPVYDGITNTTSLAVAGLVADEIIGNVVLRRFDKIALGANTEVPTGDYTSLFEPGFLVFLRNPSNTELDSRFVKVVSSTTDATNLRTIIQIETVVTDDTANVASASLAEQQSLYADEQSCQCEGTLSGWDDGGWDDNPASPLWGDTEGPTGSPPADGISDFQNLITRISNPGLPALPGSQNELWYATGVDTLFQYDTLLGWVIVWNSFSLILAATDGFGLWDSTPLCDTAIRIPATDQWINENNWRHKNDITNFAAATRANQPIIEYDWDLELNEWTYVDYRWSYRTEISAGFIETTLTPPLIELEPISWWELDITDFTNTTIILDSRYGDLTDWFTPGRSMDIGGTSYAVNHSNYQTVTPTQPYRTYVILTTALPTPASLYGSLTVPGERPSNIEITPESTLQGDVWAGYGNHWLFLGASDAVPQPHLVRNQYIDANPDGDLLDQLPTSDYEIRTSLYAQFYQITSPTVSTFNLLEVNPVVATIDTLPLRRKALFGFDDIRVYITDAQNANSVRQFGSYDEIGEAVLDVVGIDEINSEFIVSDHAVLFVSPDMIQLRGNTGLTTQTYNISPTPPSAVNRIKVVESLVGVNVSGTISNITTPLTTVEHPGVEFVNTSSVTVYVAGITTLVAVPGGINVIIEVAEASHNNIGNHYRRVRTVEDTTQYNILGDQAVSLIEHRIVEQIKTSDNQYPLFDIFTASGAPAYRANPIFGYRTSTTAPINQTGLRIVFDASHNVYEFDQLLLDEDNGELFAYRDYSNKQTDFWYNPETQELQFWRGLTWDLKTEVSGIYRGAVVSSIEPNLIDRAINGLYWYNTVLNILYTRVIDPMTLVGTWVEITAFDSLITDVNLQTIWKAGINNDEYVPERVDWNRRSEATYNTEMTGVVTARTVELLNADATLTPAAALVIATQEWFTSQVNHVSSTGQWIGDWEIPDPLYYNNQHENRKVLDSRELLTHFATIIDQQPKIPGYSGAKSSMFNLIPSNGVNFALGGTIREFNNGFDTLLSSVFVNNVTPPSLVEFANNQYEALLNSLKEIYRLDAVELLTNLETNNILNLSSFVADTVITKYELNDQNSFVYGDTTTFTDVDGVNDLGVRNWIATLPYLALLNRHAPERIINSDLSLNDVVHHDGHRNEYSLTPAAVDVISQLIINSTDPRTVSNNIGETSSVLPPNNVVEFASAFNTSVSNREGVYWYHTPNNTANVLYRYVVAESGINTPAPSFPDGTLWMDLTPAAEVLRIKTTDFQNNITWEIVNGLALGDGRLHNGSNPVDVTTATISAWQAIDLDIILGDTVYELETRLYNNVPIVPSLVYDFTRTAVDNPIDYVQYSEAAFLNYVSQRKISTPYQNTEFDASDAFTWNYKRSATGGGLNILEADGLTNSFLVSGDQLFFFDPCAASATGSPATYPGCVPLGSSVDFHIKNADVNNGTWTTLLSMPPTFAAYYDSLTNTTRVFVQGDVLPSTTGIIYAGLLPSRITNTSPNNLNNGSETGGDWRTLYTNVYGTPYPNLEPWVLQGYVDKPIWWEAEYRNDDVTKWGNRIWKYKHGFDITLADNSNNDNVDGVHGAFGFAGDFHTEFTSGHAFSIDNYVGAPTNDGVYVVANRDVITAVNVGVAGTASIVIADPSGLASAIYTPDMVFSIIQTPTVPVANNTITKTFTIQTVNVSPGFFTIAVAEEIVLADITIGVSFINASLYDPSNNTTTVKIAGLVPNLSPSGRLIKSDQFGFGMWENIRIGIIPPGQVYPNGITSVTGNPSIDSVNGLSVPALPTFNYFSVNISNDPLSVNGGTDTFNSDGVLPPYWDHTVLFLSPNAIDATIRSLFSDFSTEIVSPNANYVFGDGGTIEWQWRISSQYLYDQLTIAYQIDPVNYVSSTFGFNFTTIGGLDIDRNDNNTASHTRVNFHGDIVNDTQFKSNGINQWYVNFNRFSGYDSNFSDFRELWTSWTAPLTYQFASFVDTPSLNVSHRYVDITNFDYTITSKRSPGVTDFWMDAFTVGILNIPYDIARYDNQLHWRFELNTNLDVSRNIEYYDVHNYQFYANPVNDECLLYTWEIESVDTFNKIFNIFGDQTPVFSNGSQFNITASTGNNGTYTVNMATYDVVTNITAIIVDEVIASPTTAGLLTAIHRQFPWNTGDTVYLSTAELLPIPLLGDTVNGLTKYFIIKISDTIFKIANTPSDAAIGQAIDITSTGRLDHFVGEINSSFQADGGNLTRTNWKFYRLDKTRTLELRTPYEIQGMQRLVDIVQGYDSLTVDNGWEINSDKTQLDPDSSSIISWQVELERFINYAYSHRRLRSLVSDSYAVSVDISTDIWTFAEANQSFITGEPLTIISSNSVYPTPLSPGLQYYMIRDTLNTFRIATSRQEAEAGIAIDILTIAGVGDLRIAIPSGYITTIPLFELNPFRNSISIDTPVGIVSNIITGPVEDIRTTPAVFNQRGERIPQDQLRVYRQDLQTKIQVVPAENNENDVPLVSSAYNLLHLGGLHLFVDTYEHAMVLNNYNTEGNLLYDPFIGLNLTKYEMLFNKQPSLTQRPNVGGYVIETFFNQGTNLTENIEAGVENLRHAYDTYDQLESNLMTEYSRKGLGYEGTADYLDNLNLSRKSQFLFWRGQIQSKGSIAAFEAFVNSRRFVDAQLDDFWAIKVGEFGSIKEKEYPEMFVTTADSRSNELRLEFIDNDADITSVQESFAAIKVSDQDRWYDQPDQAAILRDNGNAMFFNMRPKNNFSEIPTASVLAPNGEKYFTHNLDADAIEITEVDTITPSITNVWVEGVDYEVVNNNIIRLLPPYTSDPITIWGFEFNDDAQNPASIIDRSSETQLSAIQFWEPARGKHFGTAIHNIDLKNNVDPARYTVTPQTITTYSDNWGANFIGTTWLNTNKLNYVPYFSKEMITDTTERFRNWGQLSDFGEMEIFEWVESDVPPAEWDVLAAQEEGDRTIVEHLRKSGTARKVLFERDPSTGSPGDWIPAVNRITEHYVATEAVISSTTYDFNQIDISNLKQFNPGGFPALYLVNVYINGRLYAADQLIEGFAFGSYNIPHSDAKQADLVSFVQLVPTDPVVIAAEIAASNLLLDYEFTQVASFDALNQSIQTYYFWVNNKRTRPTGKNRTMSISEAQIQLVTMPAPHMFFQTALPPKELSMVTNNVIRTETQIVQPIVDPNVSLDLPIAPNTPILVEINGGDLVNNGTAYAISGSPAQIITILAPLVPGDVIKITYTGIDTTPVTLPYRFSQAIIRGLQSVVDADRRYTIRFTRNFTLRDTLNVVDARTGTDDLKNAHVEWKLFRREQQTNIDRWQWDRITESMVGYKLNDPAIRVPSYERELYDSKYETQTQYGLQDGQTFVRADLAIRSIVAYLTDPNVDFTPIDINVFFANNNFDSPDAIIVAMNEIYNTFLFTDVNRMYFSVLHDAFTTKDKHPDIFKTSMLSLHGVRPFNSGFFDD